MTTLHNQLSQRIKTEIDRGGFNGTYELTEKPDKPSFEAHIELPNLDKIIVSYNPGFETKHPDKSEMVIRDLTRHEINHKGFKGYNGCPRTVELHTKEILEPIAEVLKPKGYGNSDYHYVSNALEDTILHKDLNRGFSLDGIVEFLEEIGQEKPFSPFYEAHVRLNLTLWGNKKQKQRMQPYFTHDEETRSKIREVLTQFLERTGLSKLTIDGKIKDKSQIRDFLNDEKNWKLISTIYAEEFSKLMQPGYAMPIFNHSGKGTKGKPESKKVEGNNFDKEMETPLFKKRRIEEANAKEERMPAWIDQTEGLDLLYQVLAQRLEIKAETFTKQGQLPIAHYGRRPFDPDRDNLKHTTFGFNDKGQVELHKRRHQVTTPINLKVNPKGFPRARFGIIDASGSMQLNPDNGTEVGRTNLIPWGDNSKYHFQLLGWYGFIEYLRQNHLLSQTGIDLAVMGNETVLAQGLDKAKKAALNPDFSDYTRLDVAKINKLFESSGMLLFTMSDGIIDNWDTIKDKFIAGASKHHYFHLQIGNPTTTSDDLENAGLVVVPVKGHSDLARRVIDLTDTIYRGQE